MGVYAVATFTDITETELVGVEEHTDPERSLTVPVNLTKTSEDSYEIFQKTTLPDGTKVEVKMVNRRKKAQKK